jgi:protein O-mannosyl-transferase
MDGLLKTTEKKEVEEEFSFKNYFVPLTTAKAITWIVVIGFIVYGNMLFNGFVWDDKTFILVNPDIHLINIPYFFEKNSSFNSLGQYRPIPALYFALIYSIFTNASIIYHLFQLIIHIVNAILIFVLFTRFFSNKISFFISLIFLIHPIQVESVSFIASSDNPLFFLFGISALLLSINEKINYKRLLVIFSLLLFSLLTKETGLLFVLLLIFYRTFFERKKLILFYFGGICTTALYILVRVFIGNTLLLPQDFVPIARLALRERILSIPAIIFYYLKTFFFPINLSVMQYWFVTKVNLAQFYFPLIVDLLFIVSIIGLGFYIYQSNKRYLAPFLFFFFWFLIGIGLYLQIFPLDMTVADRWFYFPIVGLLGIMGSVISLFRAPKRTLRNIHLLTVNLFIWIILFLSIRTIVRNFDWANDLTLYTHDVKYEDNFAIENGLANAYASLGNSSEALKHAKKSDKEFPFEDNLFNTGLIYEYSGNFAKAKEYYYKAYNSKILITQKQDLTVYVRLIYVLLITHEVQKAKSLIKFGLADYPNASQLWEQKAIADYISRNQNEALVDIDKAIMLSPSRALESLKLQIQNKQQIDLKGFSVDPNL